MNRSVLLVDDDPMFLEGVKRRFGLDFDVAIESNPEKALGLLEQDSSFAVIVADYEMPAMDGFSFLKNAQDLAPDSFFLLLTGHSEFEVSMDRAVESRVDKFLCKPLIKNDFQFLLDELIGEYNKRVQMRFVQDVTAQLSSPGTLSERAFSGIVGRMEQLEFSNEKNCVYALHMMLRTKMQPVARHSVRVGNLAWHLGEALGMDERDLQGLYLSALVHDIGKLMIPGLQSLPGEAYDAAASSMLRKHPLLGYQILKNFLFVRPIPLVCLQHHEHVDGSGYPNGFTARRINYDAQIIGICDFVDREILKYSFTMDWKPACQRLFKLESKGYAAPLVKTMLSLHSLGKVSEGKLVLERNILDFDC